MFNDILNPKRNKIRSKDYIIELLKYDNKRKEEVIKDLLRRITILEKQVERYEGQ